jgi:hypothetical protein
MTSLLMCVLRTQPRFWGIRTQYTTPQGWTFYKVPSLQKHQYRRALWLTPVILATQEAEIRILSHSQRIAVRGQPWQIVCETLSQKNPSQKRVGGVAQGEGPEFKPQYHKKKKKQVNVMEDKDRQRNHSRLREMEEMEQWNAACYLESGRRFMKSE